MAVVVISSAEKGDRLDGSLEVKVPMAGKIPGQIRTGGEQLDRPQQKRTRKPRKTSPAGSGSQVTWESRASVRVGKGHVGAARLEYRGTELPGVVEGGMSRRIDFRKPGTSRRQPRPDESAQQRRRI